MKQQTFGPFSKSFVFLLRSFSFQRSIGVLSSTTKQNCRSFDSLQRRFEIEVKKKPNVFFFLKKFSNFSLKRPTDLAVIAVASNNLAVLNRDQNLFDSRKRIKTASAPETEPKLNSFQKKIIQVNEALLAIYTGQVRSLDRSNKKQGFSSFQHETARRIFDKIVQKSTDTDETIPLAKVSLLIKEKNFADATQLLQVDLTEKTNEILLKFCL